MKRLGLRLALLAGALLALGLAGWGWQRGGLALLQLGLGAC
ncbi:hypothetical protein [Pseudomonas sp. RIT-PI-AD]|nr:hypothetical protein [Pseudomonas sp. RIT-PI-AD]